MIILGILLLIIGFLTGIPIVWSIGAIVLVIGLVLWLLGAMGHAVAGAALLLTCDIGRWMVGTGKTKRRPCSEKRGSHGDRGQPGQQWRA